MTEKEFDKELEGAIRAEHRKEQKDFLRSVEASLSEPEKPSRRFSLRIAAYVAVFIGLASYFFLFNEPSNIELYNEYFTPYQNVVEPIVRDQVNLSKKAQAFAYYEQGELNKALDSFDALSAEDSIDQVTIDFYKANAYLQLKKFNPARVFLLQVVDHENTEWKEESLWYLALVSLQLNDSDAAVSYLRRLEKQNAQAFKQEEVQELLNLLD